MKTKLKSLFITISMFSGICSLAQTNSSDFIKSFLQEKFTEPPILYSKEFSTAKTTGAKERVCSKVQLEWGDSDFFMIDSVDYTWSADRTSIQNGTELILEDYDVMEQKKAFFFFPIRWLKTYNTDGNIVVKLRQHWNGSTSLWTDYEKSVYTYSGDKKVSLEESRADGTPYLTNTFRYSYAYTGDELTSEIREGWNEVSDKWENWSRELMAYTMGKLSNRISQTWNPHALNWHTDATSKIDHTFSTSGNLIGRLESKWDTLTLDWVPYSKDSNIYAGSQLQEIWSTIFNKKGEITGLGCSKYIYTAGRVDEILYNYLDSGVIKSGGRALYTYDGGNLIHNTLQAFDLSGSDWQNIMRYNYAYNTNGSIISKDRQFWDDSVWIYRYSDMLDTRSVYYYETYTGIPEKPLNLKHVSLYPNPATAVNVYVDFFMIKPEKTEIVLRSIMGQEVYRMSEKPGIGDHSVMIPVANLSPGIYIVNLYCDGELSKTMKLVK